jgi:hypothetical protein
MSERAKRDRGVCRGSLWCQEKASFFQRASSADSSKSLYYCLLVGANLEMYESIQAYQRGDHPVSMVRIVGASAWNPSSNSSATLASADARSSFRLVTEQGTHLYCAAPTSTCRDLWLGALHSGLDRSLLEVGIPKQQPLQPPNPPKAGSFRARVKRVVYCYSCGKMDDPVSNPIRVKCVPMPHYNKETRIDLCSSCLIAQGLLNHVYFVKELFASAQHERKALTEAKQLCWNAMKKSNPLLEQEAIEAAAAAAAQAATESTAASTMTTSSATGEATHESSSSSSNGSSKESNPSTSTAWSMVDNDPLQLSQAWIHLPPTPESIKSVMKLITTSAEFLSLQRVSLTLETCCQQIQQGLIGVPDMLEQIEDVMGTRRELDQHAEMKKQAFRVAGDMGTAMKLLADLALPRSEYQQQQQQHSNLDLFICLLEFLLDLCQDGELASVAAFWPQLCQIHLRMLPCDNIAQLQRVELLEDFLLTVATRHSIHLALELIWSHTADLEESITSPTCSPTCRRRRYAVMRFVCELESLLFGFSGGWGGGSVSLRKLLQPSPHQDELIKLYMAGIQEMRKEVPQGLTRSVRMEMLCHPKIEKDPEVAVQESLRVARNADYFSSHLNFTRRLCDIAEKMRFLDIKERAGALEIELGLLNASGTMGGDPLNRVLEHHIRVVGVPKNEGHVFRSKERTPVLLLMEVFDDTVEDDQQQQQQLLQLESADERNKGKQKELTEPTEIQMPVKDSQTRTSSSVDEPVASTGSAAYGGEKGEAEACADDTATEQKEEEDNDAEVAALNASVGSTMLENVGGSFDEDEMYSPKHIIRMVRPGSQKSPAQTPTLPLEGSLDDSGNHHMPRKYCIIVWHVHLPSFWVVL